jgi:hypothetical protein
VFQYQLAEDYCLGNSKNGHSNERFSKPALLLKNHSYLLKTVHTHEGFSIPALYSMMIGPSQAQRPMCPLWWVKFVVSIQIWKTQEKNPSAGFRHGCMWGFLNRDFLYVGRIIIYVGIFK